MALRSTYVAGVTAMVTPSVGYGDDKHDLSSGEKNQEAVECNMREPGSQEKDKNNNRNNRSCLKIA